LNPERVLKKMREGRAALLPRPSKGAQLSYLFGCLAGLGMCRYV